MAKEDVLDKLQSLYDEFTVERLDELDEIYHDNVSFSDPIHQVVGLEDLRGYLKNTMENVKYCHFAFDDQVVNDDRAFLSWQMRFSHPKLADGKEIVLPGVSKVRLKDGKVLEQEDYYDMGAMLYEHVPLVGYVIDKIKQRLIGD
ncbi:nuclear transport factor 2 family protein [Idiomarina tyrosinivorans]|uniref:Nuclear transport factor 2 family protein n=1 Tax=Idiomarina tyrosinivorans TaxID=1445662 RepID=A0A432ZU10_9GAMM|nr:nuclear transport factor 2 family protein [Idiomarina tyrosinivorans]RUO81400.1 nuclear transport factor 2 family protein [Idiomarina tyrosinivorans]